MVEGAEVQKGEEIEEIEITPPAKILINVNRLTDAQVAEIPHGNSKKLTYNDVSAWLKAQAETEGGEDDPEGDED